MKEKQGHFLAIRHVQAVSRICSLFFLLLWSPHFLFVKG